MCGHHLRIFERAARFKISRNPRRPKRVAADLDLHAELCGAALDHAVGVDPVHGLAVQQTGAANGGAEEGALESFQRHREFHSRGGKHRHRGAYGFARPLAGVVAPGFTDPGEVDTLVRLMRIILPAQFFHVIGGLLSATLQAQDLHFLPAMAPLVYSAGIIAGGLAGAH